MPVKLEPHSIRNCCECETMWREYAHATAEHMKLLIERHMALAKHDSARETALENQIADGEARRVESRERIGEHEAAKHARMEHAR